MTRVFNVDFVAYPSGNYRVGIGEDTYVVSVDNEMSVQCTENALITLSYGRQRRTVRIVGDCHFNKRIVASLVSGHYDSHAKPDADKMVYHGRTHNAQTCDVCTQFRVDLSAIPVAA